MNAFIIKNKTVLNACLDFAKAIGLSVDSDNYERPAGEAISISTSKKFDIAGNKDATFYTRKYNITPTVLDDNITSFISDVVEIYKTIDQDSGELEENDDLLTLDDDDDDYNHEAINLLAAKVKKQKKSINNYYVINNGNNEYALTTNADAENVVGNLGTIFREINSDTF